jgi:hypothetical protein
MLRNGSDLLVEALIRWGVDTHDHALPAADPDHRDEEQNSCPLWKRLKR